MEDKLFKVFRYADSEGQTGWATAEAIARVQATKLSGRYLMVESWELDTEGRLSFDERTQ